MKPEEWVALKAYEFDRIIEQYRDDMREVGDERFDFFAFGQWVAERIEDMGWGVND